MLFLAALAFVVFKKNFKENKRNKLCRASKALTVLRQPRATHSENQPFSFAHHTEAPRRFGLFGQHLGLSCHWVTGDHGYPVN